MVRRTMRTELRDALWLVQRLVAGRKITQASCRHCGYPARGLASFDCPECGADLRQRGVIAPAHANRGLVGIAVVSVWTVVVLTLGTLSYGWAQHWLPHEMARFEKVLLVPKSGEKAILLRAKANGQRWGWLDEHRLPLSDVGLTLVQPWDGPLSYTSDANDWVQLDGKVWLQDEWMIITKPDGDYTFIAFDAGSRIHPLMTTGPGPVDRALINEWLEGAYVFTDNPDVQNEVKELLRFIDFVQDRPSGEFQFEHFEVSATPNAQRELVSQWRAAPGFAWFILWLSVLVSVLWWNERRAV